MLYVVIFGVLAFASDPVPAYLGQTNVRILGLATVISYLVALLAALAVIMPAPTTMPELDAREATYDAMMRRKVWGLGVALLCFALGTVGFAALFIVVLLGYNAYPNASPRRYPRARIQCGRPAWPSARRDDRRRARR